MLGHTGMAVRMEEDGKRIAGSDLLRAEMDAYKRGDMDALLMNALTNYDSTDDYWKLVVNKNGKTGWQEDGSLDFNIDINDPAIWKAISDSFGTILYTLLGRDVTNT